MQRRVTMKSLDVEPHDNRFSEALYKPFVLTHLQ